MDVTPNDSATAVRTFPRSLGQDTRLWIGVLVLLVHALIGYAVFKLPSQSAVENRGYITIMTLPDSPRLAERMVTMPPSNAPISAPLRAPVPELTLPGTELEAAAATTATVAVPSEPKEAFEPAPPADSPEALRDWQALLAAWVQAHKVYPPLARKRGQQGVVTVEFEVLRNGHVSSARLLRSSGETVLDAAAIALLMDVSVPPFTPDMQKRSVFVTMALDYNLQGRN